MMESNLAFRVEKDGEDKEKIMHPTPTPTNFAISCIKNQILFCW